MYLSSHQNDSCHVLNVFSVHHVRYNIFSFVTSSFTHSSICSVCAICQALWLQREYCLSPHLADSPPRSTDLKHTQNMNTDLKHTQNTFETSQVILYQEPRLSWWLSGKESACQCKRHRFDPGRSHISRSN